MRNLTKKELTKINGGHEGTAYEIGRFVGNLTEVALMFTGARAAWKGLKAIF